MTLTTRLTAFFLAALAAVLAGFSAGVYLLARDHLYQRADDRAAAALAVLTAGCEVGPEGVEWEPAERRIAAGGGVAWAVADPDGRLVGQSDAADFAAEAAAHLRAAGRAGKKLDWRGERWLFRQERVEAPPGANPAGERKYPALVVTAGVSLDPVRADLRALAGVLAGVSVAVWVAALLGGRAVCRRALRPLTRMATAAGAMTAADLGRRLPVPPTGDELSALGDSFNSLLGRVEEAFDRQRRFAAEASHQLRTPLAALLGQAEVALRRDRDGVEYRRALDTVRGQADRLRRVVEALLFLARADADAGLPNRERVDLAAWLPTHLAGWADHPRAGDITAGGDGPAWADVHPVLLGELVDALVDNALKYGPPGTPVAVRVGRTGETVTLSVADAGPGIDPADRPRVFDPFFRADSARRRGVEGAGLGLAVAKRVADAHGGTLTATAGAGGGTVFTLTLPGESPGPEAGDEAEFIRPPPPGADTNCGTAQVRR